MPRSPRNARQCIEMLRAAGCEENRLGMGRFGIETSMAFGVSMPDIREIARTTEKNHKLTLELWASGYHEARILAGLVDKPEWVTADQMDAWAADFNSWDLCDQVCGNLFDRTSFANQKIIEWSQNDQEFVRRAAYAMIAWRSVHDKKADDEQFMPYFDLIARDANDGRNFVKKAVNWALRQMGKRSAFLHGRALKLARTLSASDNPAERWIGANAARELKSPKVLSRLNLS